MDLEFEVGLKALRTLKKIFSKIEIESKPNLK